ncbi:Sialic acid TRAP transporter permease protein SiaT [Methylobrevis pamukkalensis]|uniref:Sialic acid TRAP transporter permease protein SiaT n=1 Tax=Methylobrevis pamukkalensis TaxID=1439726 RepID=A0A1E3GYE0_9HYPH|nr:Sialic acid TRAP transporter permease protein SiaT [Methylobrevis pamukkalensis]
MTDDNNAKGQAGTASLAGLLGATAFAARGLAIVGGLIIIAAAALICVEVFVRKILGSSTGVTDELCSYALAIGSTLAFPYCLVERAHIRVDSFTRLMPARLQAVIDLVALAALTGFFSLVAWYAVDTAWVSFMRDSRALTQLRTPLALPQALWAAAHVAFVPTGAVLLLIAATRLARGDRAAVMPSPAPGPVPMKHPRRKAARHDPGHAHPSRPLHRSQPARGRQHGAARGCAHQDLQLPAADLRTRRRRWMTSTSFILLAIPLYIMMGEVLLRSGMAERMYGAMSCWLSWLPGGLMHSNFASCGLFAATSGTSVATAATVGTVAIPEIERHGYDRRLFLGTLAAGGTVGILIPPSTNMILYGLLTDTSIPKLYLAGFVPGALLVLLFMATTLLVCRIYPARAAGASPSPGRTAGARCRPSSRR